MNNGRSVETGNPFNVLKHYGIRTQEEVDRKYEELQQRRIDEREYAKKFGLTMAEEKEREKKAKKSGGKRKKMDPTERELTDEELKAKTANLTADDDDDYDDEEYMSEEETLAMMEKMGG